MCVAFRNSDGTLKIRTNSHDMATTTCGSVCFLRAAGLTGFEAHDMVTALIVHRIDRLRSLSIWRHDMATSAFLPQHQYRH